VRALVPAAADRLVRCIRVPLACEEVAEFVLPSVAAFKTRRLKKVGGGGV